MYLPNFTDNIWPYLLWSPVIVGRREKRRTNIIKGIETKLTVRKVPSDTGIYTHRQCLLCCCCIVSYVPGIQQQRQSRRSVRRTTSTHLIVVVSFWHVFSCSVRERVCPVDLPTLGIVFAPEHPRISTYCNIMMPPK